MPLHLEPWGAVFVVFRKATSETSRTLPEVEGDASCHGDRPMDRGLPTGPRSAAQRHAGHALVLERQPGPGREVFLRNRDLHEGHRCPGRLVQEGCAACGSTWAT